MERTAIGSWLRSTQAFCQQLCDKETLQYGIAYYSPRFAPLVEACQFREVWIPDPSKVADAFRETESWFASRNLHCLRWSPAEGQGTEHLGPFLIERGFTPRQSLIMGLARWTSALSTHGLRILPARATRAALRETFRDHAGPSFRNAGPAFPSRSSRDDDQPLEDLRAEAAVERLDDPQLDMFVALADKTSVGRCALYQTGDIAQIVDLAVTDHAAADHARAALLHHALALAKRLTIPTVLVALAPQDRPQQALFESAGFIAAGTYVEFDRES